jgi:hypothetical protein
MMANDWSVWIVAAVVSVALYFAFRFTARLRAGLAQKQMRGMYGKDWQ